ncbi:MAG: T9SS type A sorting domain-containing protein [Flavobacteriales bacterium]|nr:T9SS type A sorting domain-containing protein [Flavobacteriales bacterium]
MKKVTVYLLFTLFLSNRASLVSAQELPCGATEMIEKSIQSNPSLRLLMEEENEKALQYSYKNNGTEGVNKIIPVVVHIIHTYGSENISKAQVEDELKILNEDFQKLNSDTNQIIQAFKGIAANSEIEFRLARIDPYGNCTEGITRTFSPLTHSANDNVKDLISWPTNKYLNMWIVEKISFGAGGYAYYPGTAPQAKYEGVVMLNKQFGGIGTSYGSNFAKRTTTHEVGHYLNLPHTWGSSNSCGDLGNCSTDDGVFDTPNTIGNCQSCDLAAVNCNSLDNVQNYMDYAVCTKMFTEGQKDRMHAALASGAGGRNNLWTNANLIATGTNDGYVPVNCIPIPDFKSNKNNICAADSVQYIDLSYNAPIDGNWQWNWVFQGGTPATSNLQHPIVFYNSPGVYNTTLTVSNLSGSDIITKNQYIIVGNINGGEVAPFLEGIEYSNFPLHINNPIKNWQYESESGFFWNRTTNAAATGTASVRLNCSDVPDDEKSSFISPPIDLSGLTGVPGVKFKVAYAKRFEEDEDMLRVYASKDCGNTWTIRYAKKGNNLVTNGGSLVSGNFVPAVTWHWRDDVANLGTTFQGLSNVLLKFELTAKGSGNYIYIDDINITVNVGMEENENTVSFSLFPNPAGDEVTISFNEKLNGKLKMLNLIGQPIMETEIISVENYKMDVGYLAKGVYLLQLHTTAGTKIQRFIKE